MKKLFSYLFPLAQKKYHSKISGALEINLVDGKKVLDTANSNYSYGSLQKILHRGLEEINFDDTIQSVLVLGMGGGSIVETIRTKFKSNAFIELVDIDEEIISIAKNEFELEKYGNLNLILKDAADYINSTKQNFDVIVIDIFIGDTVPTQFTEAKFITELSQHLNANGKIIFNTMRNTMSREVFNRITQTLTESGLRVRVIEKYKLQTI
ncbi:MAG: fused MFS/spermidine synthase [Sphingobacteriaceae bacterium]|nr:fused MFS/spermidine synthase [Sphingobacteriaceae bacterium]